MAVTFVGPDVIEHHGSFRGRLGSDSVVIEGEGSVTVATDGQPQIAVSLAAGSAASKALNQAYMPDGQLGGSGHVKWQSASVETEDGVFRVTAQPFLINREVALFGDAPQKVTLGGLATEFETVNEKPAKYWMLPVAGLTLAPSQLRFKELDGHPMWLRENQEALDAGRTPTAVAFVFDGKPAFMQQRLESVSAHQAGTDSYRSIVVGEIGERKAEFNHDNSASWFPMHLLSWLTLATGSRLAAPWIELLDDSGNLVKRIHRSFGSVDTRCGQARINEQLSPGSIGCLLTSAVQSAHFGQPATAIPLLLLNECITKAGSLEYRKVQLSRAFELLANVFDVRFKDRLIDMLSVGARAQVECLISDAVENLTELAGSLVGDECASVERIRSRVAASGSKENSFGMHVASVARHLAFADAEILNTYFATSPVNGNSTWAGVLSYLRGAVMHEGFLALDISGGSVPLREAVAVVDHLEDLLVRVLLSMVEFPGTYVSLIRRSLEPVNVDWVKSDTSAASLGFGVDWSA